MALTRGTILMLAALLAGCSTTQSLSPRQNEPEGFAPWTDAPPLYRIGSGDKLKIDYLLTPELNEEVTVGPDGYIGLKAAGRVPAQNLTMAELQALVQQQARANLRNPIVTASVVEARSARVIVGGQVENPGAYLMPARTTALEMILQAGGFKPESRMNEVIVIRARPDGQQAMIRTIDLRAFVSSGAASGNIALAPGDILFVPRSRIAEVNLWIEENINRLLPFTRSFNYNIGRTMTGSGF